MHKGSDMVQQFGLPVAAAALMALSWMSVLGGGVLVWLSGAALGVVSFVSVLLAQDKRRREDAQE